MGFAPHIQIGCRNGGGYPPPLIPTTMKKWSWLELQTINLDENLSQTEIKDIALENPTTESKIDSSSEDINKSHEEKTKNNEDDEDNESIESIPFISEPVKKRKVKNNN